MCWGEQRAHEIRNFANYFFSTHPFSAQSLFFTLLLVLVVEANVHCSASHLNSIEFLDRDACLVGRRHHDDPHAARLPAASNNNLRALHVANLHERLAQCLRRAVERKVGDEQLAVRLGDLLAARLGNVIRAAFVVVVRGASHDRAAQILTVVHLLVVHRVVVVMHVVMLLLLLLGVVRMVAAVVVVVVDRGRIGRAAVVLGHHLALHQLRARPFVEQANNQATTFKLRFVEQLDGTTRTLRIVHRYQRRALRTTAAVGNEVRVANLTGAAKLILDVLPRCLERQVADKEHIPLVAVVVELSSLAALRVLARAAAIVSKVDAGHGER